MVKRAHVYAINKTVKVFFSPNKPNDSHLRHVTKAKTHAQVKQVYLYTEYSLFCCRLTFDNSTPLKGTVLLFPHQAVFTLGGAGSGVGQVTIATLRHCVFFFLSFIFVLSHYLDWVFSSTTVSP